MREWPVENVETEKRRFAILKHLNGSAGMSLNDTILMVGCSAQGVPTTRDQVRSAIEWLRQQELVTVEELAGMIVVELREPGAEIVRGMSNPPGILRFGSGF